MTKYRFVEVKDSELWDTVVVTSPQYTIFSNSNYLRFTGRKYALYFVYKGQQIKAAISLILSDDEKRCEIDDLSIYNGILFFNNTDQKRTNSRVERFELTEFIIEELNNAFSSIEIALSPEFEDMRPFLWHNYHSSNPSDKFIVDLRYTSRLDISEFFLKKCDEDISIYRNLDGKRQSDIKKSIQSGLRLCEFHDANLFVSYYDKLLISQGTKTPENKLNRMKVLIDKLIESNMAKYYVTKNKNDQITYATIFTIHVNKGCYLFGAGNLDLMQRYDGTFCIWESMKRLSTFGIHEIDLEGVNSPQRGWFKLGFGGDLKPYYQIYKRK